MGMSVAISTSITPTGIILMGLQVAMMILGESPAPHLCRQTTSGATITVNMATPHQRCRRITQIPSCHHLSLGRGSQMPCPPYRPPMQLLDRPDRPFAVRLGSCSWPSLMIASPCLRPFVSSGRTLKFLQLLRRTSRPQRRDGKGQLWLDRLGSGAYTAGLRPNQDLGSRELSAFPRASSASTVL